MADSTERGHAIFVYCDDPSHARRVAVTNFVYVDPGWDERYTRTNGINHGTTLGEDGPRPEGVDVVRWARSGPKRYRYELACRKCRRPVQLREENLWPALHLAAAQALTEVSLGSLAAIVAKSKERGVDPELEQG